MSDIYTNFVAELDFMHPGMDSDGMRKPDKSR